MDQVTNMSHKVAVIAGQDSYGSENVNTMTVSACGDLKKRHTSSGDSSKRRVQRVMKRNKSRDNEQRVEDKCNSFNNDLKSCTTAKSEMEEIKTLKALLLKQEKINLLKERVKQLQDELAHVRSFAIPISDSDEDDEL